MVRNSSEIARRSVLKRIGASSIGVAGITGGASATVPDENNSDSDSEFEIQAADGVEISYTHDPITKVVDEYYNGADIVEVNVTATIEPDDFFRAGGSKSALTFYWEESSWTLHDASGFEPTYHCNNHFKESVGSFYELIGDDLTNPSPDTNHGNDPSDFDRYSIVWENDTQTYDCTSSWYCNNQDKSYGAYESTIWARIYLLNQNADNSPGDINVEAAYLPTGNFDVLDDISISAGGLVYHGLGGWFEPPEEVTLEERMYCCDEDGERISMEDL